jgi:small-conductance mechanosensitive channel/CRP-like cAMP-binding protein
VPAFDPAFVLQGGLGGALQALAVVIAVAAVLLAFLPVALRPRLRAPVILALACVVLRLVERGLHQGGTARVVISSLALLAMLLAFGRLLSLVIVEWLVVQRLRRDPPKILRDIFESVLVIAALLVTLRAAGVDPTSLLTTSAVLTAIIGLSMQDTLGNLFAGLSLQAERPFEVGDWIQYDPASKHMGRVMEISWRATKIRTQDLIDIVIPNGQLARASILNYSKPSALSRRSVFVTVPHGVPTKQVHATILAALRGVEGVMTDPPPNVVTHAFQPHGVEYWLRFFITELEHRDGIDGRVRDRIWYGLSRAEVPLATSAHRVQLTHDTPESEARDAERALDERQRALRTIDLFRDLPDSALGRVASAARLRRYETGEIVVDQGEQGEELYLCVRGRLSVTHTIEGARESRELARLDPGGIFGELSLLTGAPRSATVIAVQPCELLVIDKDALAPVLGSEPDLAERLSARLAERQAAIEALVQLEERSERVTLEERQGQLLGRIKAFFSL